MFTHKGTAVARRHPPVLLFLLVDILTAALLVFGCYYFVYEAPLSILSGTSTPLPQSQNHLQSGSHEPAAGGTEAEGGCAPNAQADPQPVTLREKFAEHFTDTVVSTDTTYSSPNLSVEVTTHTQGSGNDTVTYYVADVYMADLSSFQTEFAGGSYETGNQKEPLADMSQRLGAILAMNGDSYCFNRKHCNGLLVRGGVVYRNNPTTQDICVLYQDGTMATYGASEFDAQAALDQGVLDTWIFGPRLLDSSGKAMTSFDTWDYIKKIHPRTAMGYYEPGHYCFVVVDGRQTGYSRGMSLPELAQVFEDMGCAAAYNLDGGHTVFMTMDSQYVNHSYKPSKTISDCICICEPPQTKGAQVS